MSSNLLCSLELLSWQCSRLLLHHYSLHVLIWKSGHKHVLSVWYDTLCGNVNMVHCLRDVQVWMWFGEILTTNIISWWILHKMMSQHPQWPLSYILLIICVCGGVEVQKNRLNTSGVSSTLTKPKSNLKFVVLEVNFVCFRCPVELRCGYLRQRFYLVGAELEEKKARNVVTEYSER